MNKKELTIECKYKFRSTKLYNNINLKCIVSKIRIINLEMHDKLLKRII